MGLGEVLPDALLLSLGLRLPLPLLALVRLCELVPFQVQAPDHSPSGVSVITSPLKALHLFTFGRQVGIQLLKLPID